MHRIDSTSKAANLFGAGKDGFTEGDPVSGVAATQFTGAFCNALQEEPANALEDFGVALVKTDNTQLRQLFRAVQRAFATNLMTALASGVSDDLKCIGADGVGDQPRWCAGSTVGAVLTSRGGALWTTAYTAADAVVGLAWNAGAAVWVAVIANRNAISSADGVTWGLAASFVGNVGDVFAAVCSDGALAFVVGMSSADAGVIYSSTNGVGWTSVGPAGLAPLKGICVGSKYVAVGLSGNVVTSPDGVTWTAGAGVGGGVSLMDVAYSARSGLFVAVGSAGALFTSPDGTTWTDRTIAGGPDFTRVAADPYGGFLAVGGARAFSSDNGTNWTERAVNSSETLEAVAFSKGAWLAAGAGGSLLTGARF